jgi:hypothetical protein
MFSIDQNCHSLWDVVPKLQALARGGMSLRHWIEDVDVAFTSVGSPPGQSALRLARERFYRSGGSDWGAAMFYSDFLGRLPVEIRDFEEFTGLKTAALARQLGRTVDDLYEEFSCGDNWQLIGPSYVGDVQHHRVIGDLRVSEAAAFLLELLDKARANMLATFPQEEPRCRLTEWFAQERRHVEQLIAELSQGRLVDLYASWLRRYVDKTVEVGFLSSLLAPRDGSAGAELLRVFCLRYQEAAGLYNQSLSETGSHLRPLDTTQGELPFFVTLQRQDHLVRTGIFLTGKSLRADDREFAVAADGRVSMSQLAQAGLRCLVGKAILLAIQVRLGRQGDSLALPYRGSLYMPAALRLAERLAEAGLLPGTIKPLVRVRFHLLDRLQDIDTVILLPEHLRGYFGAAEIPAGRLAEEYPAVAARSAGRLETLRSAQGRQRWLEENFPSEVRQVAELDGQRRRLAEVNSKSPEIRNVWKRIKAIQMYLLDRTFRQIACDWQARDIDYWDSRGALLPWSIALGGQAFYDDLVARAEIYEEPTNTAR